MVDLSVTFFCENQPSLTKVMEIEVREEQKMTAAADRSALPIEWRMTGINEETFYFIMNSDSQ